MSNPNKQPSVWCSVILKRLMSKLCQGLELRSLLGFPRTLEVLTHQVIYRMGEGEVRLQPSGLEGWWMSLSSSLRETSCWCVCHNLSVLIHFVFLLMTTRKKSCLGVYTFINTGKGVAETSACSIDLESAAGSPKINKALASFLSPLPCQFPLPQICLFPFLILLLLHQCYMHLILLSSLMEKKIMLNAK